MKFEKVRKVFTAEVKAAASGVTDYDITATVSTSTVDRQGDVIVPTGIDLANYKRNPVILWAHNYFALPVGKCIGISVNDDKVSMRIKWAAHEFAQTVKTMYADGFLSAFSVGFMPREVTEMTGNGRAGYDYEACELLEVSGVPVPANPEALVEGRAAELFVKALQGPAPMATPPTAPAAPEAPIDEARKAAQDAADAAAAQPPLDVPPLRIVPVLGFKDIDQYADALSMLKENRVVTGRHLRALNETVVALQAAVKALDEIKSVAVKDEHTDGVTIHLI